MGCKKFPTFIGNDEFITKWNHILTDCSICLMTLILEQKQNTYGTIKQDLTQLQTDLSVHHSHSDYEKFGANLQKRLHILEAEIMTYKNLKFTRDKTDYDTNRFYFWPNSPDSHYKKCNFRHTSTHKSILKTPGKYKMKKVSFSSTDADSFDVETNVSPEYCSASFSPQARHLSQATEVFSREAPSSTQMGTYTDSQENRQRPYNKRKGYSQTSFLNSEEEGERCYT
ncbi:hypothetical protein XELAEV_18009994mg [Xenopus laevis]|uniref:Uncharacterized protein n=1 Tax=Xenopus laevis TaxID=8355 RepID=A0A974DUK5_XENLA|nr:hypothetical protein XELAEV_18009994mg [Xenopus laevis]